MAAPSVVGKALRSWRRDGPAVAAAHAWRQVRKRVYLREEHVWYQLDVAVARPRRELPPEVRLAQASAAETQRVQELGQDPDTARARHAAGSTLWLALDGHELLFSCWTFRARAPVLAAPGGWLNLWPDVACLEDSATSPAARGRGIAPGAWTAIADQLAQEGFTALITKVGVDNAASRKAVVKSGFREIGLMRLRRVAMRRRVTLEPGSDGLGEELRGRLGASG